MKIKKTNLSGVLLVEPIIYSDNRGQFLETYQYSRYAQMGIPDLFVQDNQSWSSKEVLRGLHYQVKNPQAQLITVIKGVIFDVVVDLRKDSGTFGEWFGVKLGGGCFPQIYMAPGFAHGFYALSDEVGLHYKVTQEYNADDDAGIIWNDKDLNIKWPSGPKILSIKDANFPELKNFGFFKSQ